MLTPSSVWSTSHHKVNALYILVLVLLHYIQYYNLILYMVGLHEFAALLYYSNQLQFKDPTTVTQEFRHTLDNERIRVLLIIAQLRYMPSSSS